MWPPGESVHIGARALSRCVEKFLRAVGQTAGHGAERYRIVEPLADLCPKFELWICLCRSLECVEDFVGDLRWALHAGLLLQS